MAMSFPISIKGVLLEAGRVVLLENERSEWELPGGRLQAGEDPSICLAREIAEELGIKVAVKPSSTAGFTKYCRSSTWSS